MIQPLWRTVWSFLKKLKIELPYNPKIPLLDVYPEKTIIGKDTGTPMFIAALFTIAKTWNQPKCPLMDEWTKIWCIYTMEYYSTIKENEIMSFGVTWVDLEIVIFSEVSQTEKDKYMISLICGIWKKMVQMKLFTKRKESYRCRKQTYGYQGGKGGGPVVG